MSKSKMISDNLTGPPTVDLPLSQSPVHHLETLDPRPPAQDDQGRTTQSESSSALPEGNSDRSGSSGGDNSGNRKS